MRFIAAVFVALLLPTSVHAEGNTPPSMLRIDGPATVYAPAVRVDPPGPQPERSVEQIIRDAWPDRLEDRALRIAWRESNWQPAVINRNRNATGLFQIMWTVHRGWLCPEMGICAQSQLQDADTNARAAYALYVRTDDANGPYRDGWSPWQT